MPANSTNSVVVLFAFFIESEEIYQYAHLVGEVCLRFVLAPNQIRFCRSPLAGANMANLATPPSLISLPAELALHIFSFLHPADLLSLIATNKHFFLLASDDALWKDLAFTQWNGNSVRQFHEVLRALTRASWFEYFKSRFCWLQRGTISSPKAAINRDPVRLLGHNDQINSCSLSSNDDLLVTTSRDKTVRVFFFPSLSIIKHFIFLVPCQTLDTLQVWNIETGGLLKILEGHTDFVYHAYFFEDVNTSTKIISSGADGMLRVKKTFLHAKASKKSTRKATPSFFNASSVLGCKQWLA